MNFIKSSLPIKNNEGEYCSYSLYGLDRLSFFCALCIKDTLWISNNRYNGLFSYNMNTEEIIFHGHFPNELQTAKGLHKAVAKYKNKLFFFPELSKNISEYDIETKLFKSYNITIEGKQEYAIINSIIVEQEKVFIFPQYLSQPIIIFNMENASIVKDFSLTESIRGMGMYTNQQAFAGICSVNGNAWLPMSYTNVLLEFDYHKMEIVKAFKIGTNNSKLKKISYDGSDFWISDAVTSKVVCWNPKANVIQDLKVKENVAAIICVDKYVYILLWTGTIIRIEKRNNEIVLTDEFLFDFHMIDDFLKDWNSAAYWGYMIKNDKIILYPLTGNLLIFIDINSGKIEGKELLTKCLVDLNYFFKEIEHLSLQNFLNFVIGGGNWNDKESKENYGKKIYSVIKAEIS